MFLVDFDSVCMGGSVFRTAWRMSIALPNHGSRGFLHDLPEFTFKAVRVSRFSLTIDSLLRLDGESFLNERASLAFFPGAAVDRKRLDFEDSELGGPKRFSGGQIKLADHFMGESSCQLHFVAGNVALEAGNSFLLGGKEGSLFAKGFRDPGKARIDLRRQSS